MYQHITLLLSGLLTIGSILNASAIESTQNNIELDQEASFDYTTHLHRFHCPIYKYNPGNAAALDQIDIFVSQASGNNNPNLPPPPGFDLSIPISGIDPITGLPSIFAYIFTSEKKDMLVLSFTGTQTISQLISDLRFRQVRPFKLNFSNPEMLVHKGFYSIYLAVQETIRETVAALLTKNTQFVISGHSLGGALTTLAALDLAMFNPIVYTFASPRVGNPGFAETYNTTLTLGNTWRVFNTEDIIPGLPTPEIPLGIKRPIRFIYEHVGNPVPFTLNLGTILLNHIQAYHSVIINREAPVNPNGICPNRCDCSEKK